MGKEFTFVNQYHETVWSKNGVIEINKDLYDKLDFIFNELMMKYPDCYLEVINCDEVSHKLNYNTKVMKHYYTINITSRNQITYELSPILIHNISSEFITLMKYCGVEWEHKKFCIMSGSYNYYNNLNDIIIPISYYSKSSKSDEPKLHFDYYF